MTPEEKKAAETAQAEAEAKAKEEKEKADAGDPADGDDPSQKPDYEAMLKKEREAREAAEKKLADQRFKDSERKRKGDDKADDVDDEDKPLTTKQLEVILARERQANQREMQSERVLEIAKDIADSDTEAQLIVEIHKNRQFPSSLSLREQVEEAHAIANRKKLVSTNAELKRALRSKDTASKDSAGTHRDPMEGSAPKIASDLEASLKKQQFEFDSKTKVWKKKLPNGKFLYKDVRSKPIRTWVA